MRNSHVGAVMREARTTLGYSQDSLAAELGISRDFICDVERGTRTLAIHRMAKTERFLSLERGALLRAACRDGRVMLLPVGLGEASDAAACTIAIEWPTATVDARTNSAKALLAG